MRTLYLLLVLTCLIQIVTVTAQSCPSTPCTGGTCCNTQTSNCISPPSNVISSNGNCVCLPGYGTIHTPPDVSGGCKICPFFSFAAGGGICQGCPFGAFSPSGTVDASGCLCPVNTYGTINANYDSNPSNSSCTACPNSGTSSIGTMSVSGCKCGIGSYFQLGPTTYNTNSGLRDTFTLTPTSTGPSDIPSYQITNFASNGSLTLVSYQYSDQLSSPSIQNYVSVYNLVANHTSPISTIPISDFGTFSAPTVFLKDVSLDGIPDMVLAGSSSLTNSYVVDVWTGNLDGSFSFGVKITIGISPTQSPQPIIPALVDVDNDGLLDLVFIYLDGNAPSGLYVYVALGTPGSYFREPANSGAPSISGIIGDPNVPPFMTIGKFISGDVSDMLVATVVGSNYVISLLSYNPSSLRFELSSRSPNSWQTQGTPGTASIATFVGFVDTATGAPHLIVGVTNSLYIMSDFNNLNAPTQTITLPNVNFNGSPVYSLSNNGFLDIVASFFNFNPNVNAYQIGIYRNVAGIFSLSQTLTLTTSGSQIRDYYRAASASVQFTDVNHDNIIDIVHGLSNPDASNGNNEDVFFNVYYGTASTSASCISCPSGTSTSSIGATNISSCQCPANYYPTNSSNVAAGCLSCPSNSGAPLGALNINACQCLTNYSQINTTNIAQGCSPCSQSFISTNGSPCACPSNQCLDSSNPVTCMNPPVNTTNTNGFCTCNSGYGQYNTSNISNGCHQCPANTYSDGRQCVQCPYNKVSSPGSTYIGCVVNPTATLVLFVITRV
jgi:hypothetical protein